MSEFTSWSCFYNILHPKPSKIGDFSASANDLAFEFFSRFSFHCIAYTEKVKKLIDA